ncbi:hypothetical protein ACLMJK_004795 [Lecanora helva]
MEPCQVFLFGDLTKPFEEDLRQLLHVRGNGALSSFLDQVGFALREEIGKLSSRQQELFPRFTTLVDLLSSLKTLKGIPALRFSLVCLYQIGQFIRYYGEGSRPFPKASNSYLVGVCTGAFAAAAISTSQTLSELVPAGIEAAIAAFRTGLRSLELGRDIEGDSAETPQSWSGVVSLKESQAKELIESFAVAKLQSLPANSRPYLSAISPKNVTISGPPNVLKEFFAIESLDPYYLPIESPYHSPLLFQPSDIDDILAHVKESSIISHKSRMPFLSASSGQIIDSQDFRSLLATVIKETLCHQIRWDKILESITETVLEHTAFEQSVIYPLSSNAANLLQSTLSKNTSMQVSISDFLDSSHSKSSSTRPTGKFEQSKIAIIGFSGRFPESASNEEFWELLHAGRDVHRTIPEDRFNWKTHFDATGKAKNTSRIQYGCFIKEPGLFDARFFNMSPRESENTDPAQRLAITTTYEAIEMAGMVLNRTPSTQQDRIGVFFGTTSDDWREVNSGQNVDTYFIPGGNRAFVPGRISYFFRFCGPSLSIDTACSSSFAAIQTACSYLWRGDIDTAVAGGTNVLTNSDNFAGLDRGHFLSTTGNCNTFDDAASGYCRSDAVGSVILKRLEDAQADCDPIFGVIAGATTNHCGQTDSITRPHEGDQVSVFNRIMRNANVNPLDVSYIEMHGTGTQAGDATEMRSVLKAFVPNRERMPRYPLHVGSAKANIGHAESASGVSSLIKVLTMMKMNEIPPHCGIKTKINHSYPLDLQDRNVNIAFKPTPWNRADTVSGKRTAFLNNFSAAGGNTAILLEDCPIPEDRSQFEDERTTHVVALTGKTSKSLTGNIQSLIEFLDRNPNVSLPALSYTTTARRMHHNYRTICSGSDIRSVQEALKSKINDLELKSIPSGPKVPKVAFAFTGQGSTYIGIGRQLYESLSHFRSDIRHFDRIAQQQGFRSFIPLVDGSAAKDDVDEPILAHLALSCVQMALTKLWLSWGITPVVTIGHSLGEYAALFAAGVLTANDTIFLVGSRAQLLSKHCRAGTNAMLAIKAHLDDIEPELSGTSCEVACMNQPKSNVVSGPNEQISGLTQKFKSLGYECVKLNIPYAFHSAQVEPILDEFETIAKNVRFKTPAVPYLSPLLGKAVSDSAVIGAPYLVRACREAVGFQGALEAAKSVGLVNEQTIWLENGSHPVCSDMIKGTLGAQIRTLNTLKKSTDTWRTVANGLETLYLNGVDVDWNQYHRDFKGSQTLIALPRYSWDLKNYWIQYRNDFCLTKGDDPAPKQITAPPTVVDKPAPIYLSPSVQRVLEEHNAADVSTLLIESDIHDPRLASVIQGHKVNTVALCPSSLYADIAITMAQYMTKNNAIQGDNLGLNVADMKVERPLIAVSGSHQVLRVSASASWKDNVISLSFSSTNVQGRKVADHAACIVKLTMNQTWLQDWKRNAYLVRSRIKALQHGVDDGVSHKLKRGIAYKLFSALVDYSANYQGMQEVVLDSEELEATAKISFGTGDDGYSFNPCWVDSFGHLAGFIMNANDNVQSKEQVFVNHGWDAMRSATTFSKDKKYRTYNRMQLVSGTMYSGDTYIFEEDQVVAIFEGVKFQGVPRQVLDQLLPSKSGPAKSAPKSSNPAAKPSEPSKQQKPQPTAKPVTTSKPKEKPASSPLNNDVLSRVMHIISEEAGLDLADLAPNAEFTDQGIDSLLSLTISGRIQEELNLELPSTVFTDYPTVKDLTDFLGGTKQPPESPESQSDVESVFSPDSDTISTPATDMSTPAIDIPTDKCETEASSVVGPDNIVESIRARIAEETGVSATDIGPSTSFTELGMDSLLTLTIMGKLSEELEMDFAATLLSDNDTLDEVEKALGLSPKKVNNNKSLADAARQVVEAEPDSPPQATSILLQGNAKAATKKLFLFPDGSGSATSYASIPKVSSDVAVYGLNCPWQKTPQDMKCSFETAATKYLLEIHRRQQKGPYYFGGWSAGGILAYECAQQLARKGEETARLILIDSPNPVGLENPPERMYDFFDTLDFFGTNGKAPPTWLRPHFNAFLTTLDNYKVRPFAGPPLKTHLVYARDGICKHPDDPRPETRPDDPREMLWLLNNRTDFSGGGWGSLVGNENLQIQVLDDVNHFSMVAPGPKIGDLAAFLKRALQ